MPRMNRETQEFSAFLNVMSELLLALEARGVLDEAATEAIVDEALAASPGADATVAILGNLVRAKRARRAGTSSR